MRLEFPEHVVDFFVRLNEVVRAMDEKGRIRDVNERAAVVEGYLRGYNQGQGDAKVIVAKALRERAADESSDSISHHLERIASMLEE